MKTLNTGGAESTDTKELRTEKSEEAEGTKKDEKCGDTFITGIRAEKPEAGSEVELLKSLTKKYCVFRQVSFDDVKNE